MFSTAWAFGPLRATLPSRRFLLFFLARLRSTPAAQEMKLLQGVSNGSRPAATSPRMCRSFRFSLVMDVLLIFTMTLPVSVTMKRRCRNVMPCFNGNRLVFLFSARSDASSRFLICSRHQARYSFSGWTSTKSSIYRAYTEMWSRSRMKWSISSRTHNSIS